MNTVQIYRGERLEPTSSMAAAIAAAGYPQRVEPITWQDKGRHIDGYGKPNVLKQGWHIETTSEVGDVVESVMTDTAMLKKGPARREKREKEVTKRLLALAAR